MKPLARSYDNVRYAANHTWSPAPQGVVLFAWFLTFNVMHEFNTRRYSSNPLTMDLVGIRPRLATLIMLHTFPNEPSSPLHAPSTILFHDIHRS